MTLNLKVSQGHRNCRYSTSQEWLKMSELDLVAFRTIPGPAPLKLRPYGAIQMCILLLLLLLLLLLSCFR